MHPVTNTKVKEQNIVTKQSMVATQTKPRQEAIMGEFFHTVYFNLGFLSALNWLIILLIFFELLVKCFNTIIHTKGEQYEHSDFY